MPLTRPKKNPSRSPGISSASYFQSSSTPKGFHPPSYYAAAAGLSPSHPDQDRSSDAQTHRTTTTDRTVVDFDYSFVPAPMPTAQLPVSSSASSTEPSLVSRMSFLNRRLSKGNGTGNKSSSKRRSQLTDLPLVEAQLVPSLRDTIDRMTNSPNSQTHSPAIGSHASSQINPPEALHSPSQHFQYPSTPRTRQQQTGYLRIVPTPSPSTPKFSNVQESSRIPTPVAATKTKPGLKPALKNAVASSSVSNSGQGNQSSPTKASPARSLRSVKGIIGRKTPQIPADIAPLDMAATQVRDHPARERSRTDPGHVSKIPSLSPYVQATPRMPPPVSVDPTPGRAPRGIPLNRRYAAISDSSGSELNLHGERGRALFVTNAVIVPSSSSSSEEVEASQAAPIRNSPAWKSRAHQENYPYDGRLAQQGVGLGLGMSDRIRDTHSHVRPLAESGRIDPDAESEYHSDLGDEDEDHLAVSSSASSAHLRSLIQNRQTLRPPDLTRNVSTTSGDSLPNPWDMDSSGSGHNESDQRRRELIELVKGMEKGPFGSSQPYEFDSMSDDEYVGEHGLAISPSDDFSQNTNTTLRPGDEDGGHSRRRSAVAGPSHATPGQPFTQGAPAGERAEHSSSRKLPGTYDRVGNQATLVRRNDQETELSPLSQYSGDEDGKCGPGNTKNSSSSTRNNRSPITQDGPFFRSIREGDRPLSSRESPGRIPRKNVPPLSSMRRDSFGTEGSSQRTNRASRDAATSLPQTGLPEAHVAGGIQSLSRVCERKVTRQPPTRVQRIPLPHSDSTSSIESLRWHNEDQDISVDAEAIFGQLGTQNQSTTNGTLPALSQRQERGKNVTSNRSSKSPLPRALNPLPRLETDLYESHGGRNAYEGANPLLLPNRDERNSPTPEHERRTWLSTITSSAYHSLLDRYGEVEIQRQQIIWDLCETERAFVRRLRTFVRVFIRPLRMKDSVSWLAGVPPEVARLFDWLEDLINIHAQISSALRAIVSEQYPIVMRIAGRIRSFVSRLEVHQSYVVRLESTTLLIKRLTGESSSDFGEFIRIQQEQDECHGWSVEAFLVEPVNRLVDYPIHFKRLLDVTPRDHPDHLATFSLLHCTETMIRVMREVKLQEEEYALVKERLGKISGLPTSVQLAHRSRRLLARGRLEREYPRDRVRISTNGGTLRENESSDPATGVRQSRLISAIQSRAMRSDSMRTTSESTTSIASHFSRDLPTTPYPPQRLASASSSIHPNLWDGQYATPRNARHSLGPLGLGQHTQTLYALVFNDIVLLASPALSGRHDSDQVAQIDSWCLLEGIGLSRVLKVVEDSNQIILDLLPVDPENVATGGIPDSGQVIILTLSIPSTSSAGVRLDTPSLSRLRQNWISAFQECAEHTLRALSFPTQSGKLVAPTPGVAWDNDAQTSVSAILASGLPLPKSPSTQLAEKGTDPAQQEREARGWWALRFQQVLREMQHGSSGGALITISPGTSAPSRETAGKRVRSQPRVLKLSSLSSSESIVNRPP
ncbi:hypothetical protein EDB89DRAFT_588664 [Lactarius sanguifluus]|nr:hypothetical protein EDB89DRAFT_588664 [Lactarius sanguifluus]